MSHKMLEKYIKSDKKRTAVTVGQNFTKIIFKARILKSDFLIILELNLQHNWPQL